MTRSGDPIVLFLLIGVIFYFFLRKWFSFSYVKDWVFNQQHDPEPVLGEVPDLLRQCGYEPISDQIKVPLSISIGSETYESRFYIDYLVENQFGKQYAVIVSRSRRPLRMVGASIRDFFFAQYQMVQPMGLLYVDLENQKVKEVVFQYQSLLKQRPRFPWAYLVIFVLGMLVAWTITK